MFTLKCELKNPFVSRFLHLSMPVYFLHMLMMNVLSLVLFSILKLNWEAVRNPIAGNLAYILAVYVLSALLYTGVVKAWCAIRGKGRQQAAAG